MTFNIFRYYKQKRFKPNQISNCFNKIIADLNLPEDRVSFRGSYDLGDSIEESRDFSPKDLDAICEIKDRPHALFFSFPSPDETHSRSNIIILSDFRDALQLNLGLSEASNSDAIVNTIESLLSLEQVSPPEYTDKEVEAIKERLTKIEEKLIDKEKALSCFLSYRFTSRSKTLALELTRFLELLGSNVISGAGYEPRRLNEKVISRLSQPFDFLIYLITKEGESTWTRDELAVTMGKGFPAILLVESGVEVGKGLLGDWEYLQFQDNHIADTFIGILEALRFIKNKWNTDLEKIAPDSSD